MNLLRAISDHGNPMLSKLINYFGVGVGVGGGTVQVAASQIHNNPIVDACANAAPDWIVYAPIVGVVSLVIKNAADFIFRRIEHKHKMREINEDNIRKKQALDKQMDTE